MKLFLNRCPLVRYPFEKASLAFSSGVRGAGGGTFALAGGLAFGYFSVGSLPLAAEEVALLIHCARSFKV